jgi:hypothetical protein
VAPGSDAPDDDAEVVALEREAARSNTLPPPAEVRSGALAVALLPLSRGRAFSSTTRATRAAATE